MSRWVDYLIEGLRLVVLTAGVAVAETAGDKVGRAIGKWLVKKTEPKKAPQRRAKPRRRRRQKK